MRYVVEKPKKMFLHTLRVSRMGSGDEWHQNDADIDKSGVVIDMIQLFNSYDFRKCRRNRTFKNNLNYCYTEIPSYLSDACVEFSPLGHCTNLPDIFSTFNFKINFTGTSSVKYFFPKYSLKNCSKTEI